MPDRRAPRERPERLDQRAPRGRLAQPGPPDRLAPSAAIQIYPFPVGLVSNQLKECLLVPLVVRLKLRRILYTLPRTSPPHFSTFQIRSHRLRVAAEPLGQSLQ